MLLRQPFASVLLPVTLTFQNKNKTEPRDPKNVGIIKRVNFRFMKLYICSLSFETTSRHRNSNSRTGKKNGNKKNKWKGNLTTRSDEASHKNDGKLERRERKKTIIVNVSDEGNPRSEFGRNRRWIPKLVDFLSPKLLFSSLVDRKLKLQDRICFMWVVVFR